VSSLRQEATITERFRMRDMFTRAERDLRPFLEAFRCPVPPKNAIRVL